MKVVEKGKEKKVMEASAPTLNTIKAHECYDLNRAIFELSSSTQSMKGKIVYALQKNETKLHKLIMQIDKKRREILDKYVKIDQKTKEYVLEVHTEEEIAAGKQAEYVYSDKNGKENTLKEVNDLMNSEFEVDFHKIYVGDWNNLDISTARNPMIGLLMDKFITEEMNLNSLN